MLESLQCKFRPVLCRFVPYIFASLLTSLPVSAQVTVGTPPFGSFNGGPDIVNIGNLNVQEMIPVRQKAGRGTDFVINLVYNSSVWVPSGTWQFVTTTNIPGWQGLSPSGQAYIGYSTTYSSGQCTNNGYNWYMWQNYGYGGFYYYDQQGIRHNFNTNGSGPLGWGYITNNGAGICGPTPGFYPSSATQSLSASDGSGYTMKVTPVGGGSAYPTVSSNDGTIINAPIIANPSWGSISTTDRNGNQITSSNGVYTDTLNKTALSITGSAPSNTNLCYMAPSGGNACFVVSYKTYVVRTNFGCSGIVEYNTSRSAQTSLVDKVTLPDGSAYQFNYEVTYQDTHAPHDVTGRIASIQMPTGGTTSYQYSTGTSGVNGISCSDGSATTLLRTTPDGQWTYTRTQVSGNHWQTKITTPPDPANQPPVGNDTVVDFWKDSATSQNTNNFYETQRLTYQGSSSSGTLLQTATTCYNTNTSSCTTTAVSSPITQRNVTSQFGSTGRQALEVFKYISTGLLSEEDDYDYASGPPTVVLRKTFVTYASLGNGIGDRPASVTICSASGTSSSCGNAGTVVAQTTYTYDHTTPATSSGTPQHVSITGSRGNATTVARFVQGSTNLSQTYTYYDTGMLQTATDVNNATTTDNYPDAISTCGNAFATSVNLPITNPQLTRYYTWNCDGAVATQFTDENGGNTIVAYTDLYFWRPASTTDPTNAVVNYSYPSSSPYNWSETTLTVVSNTSVLDKLTTFDGVGRVHVQQVRQGPTSPHFDTVETDYDALGRTSRVTQPYSGNAGQTSSTAPATTLTYDALNRTLQQTDAGTTAYTYPQNDAYVTIGPQPTGENTKRRQLEYDGLGRLSSVCEVTNAAQSGNCGQNSPATGYLTSHTYDAAGNLIGVTQNAQPGGTAQTRSYSYDGLARMISETNPEIGPSSGPAPITYAYDSATGCTGTYSGDLVKKVDQVGNTTCFAYDALHRTTSITYSGPYSSVTPNRYFAYDTATVNGTAMVKVKNRLAEAYTATTQSGTKITDEGFSYTARGEVSDVYELTPHSNSSYYHVAQTYWPHGAPSQLSSNITGLPTIGYGGTIGSTAGLDGEAHVTQVTAGSGQNPVTNVAYNPYGSPPQSTVTFGSGDSDVFSYDANTARMTQYQFNINSQSSTGVLTWNANSSLQKLVITDPFNSADNQTCNYGFDDMLRVTSANCGSAANQTFSYDPFGNINKSGSPYSFQPTYSATTNRMTSLGSFTPTYDNNGNVTNDSNHTYAWDANGNSVTIDSVGLTFDALDRAVEKNVSGTYTPIVYSPTGEKLALMGGSGGQTLQNAFVSLPGKAMAVYTSSGLDHYRHADWLGSARLSSSPSRTVLSTVAYAPFGEKYAQSGSSDLSFTGMNQDTVTSDYDFLYREYSTEGRWPSPDPAGLGAGNPVNPQSWNRYAYVMNNPLGFVDPLGLDGQCTFGDGNEYPCWGYDASYNSLVNGVPPTGPSLGGPQYDGNGNYLFTACSPPAGTMNIATNCGYQGGEETKIPRWYQQMVNQVQCAVTKNLSDGSATAGDCSNIPPFLLPYLKSTGTGSNKRLVADWASFLGAMDLPDALTVPSAPQLTPQYVQSLSWGAIRQNAVQQSCKQAAQAITRFEKMNPGAPVPPALLQAVDTCGEAGASVQLF